jgi:hypothetical protein
VGVTALLANSGPASSQVKGIQFRRKPMSLVGIILVLVVVGLIMWMINSYIPMAGAIKSLLNIVVFVVLLIWILQTFGLIGAIPGFRMPALK